MAEWTDYPAEVVALEFAASQVDDSNLDKPVTVLGIEAMSQVDLTYPAYPGNGVGDCLVQDMGFSGRADAVLVAPGTLIIELDYDTNFGMLYGLPQDPVWVVTLHCQQKPLQYWG